MDILTRNYFKEIRNGAFAADEKPEPMSEYKWRVLRKRADDDNVLTFIQKGAEPHPLNFEEHKQGRRYRNIAKKEYHAIDTSLDSLDLLNIMLYNIDCTMSGHTSLRGVVEMGRYLRMKGDKVDFVKLETWLRRLGVYNMARLHGSMLIALMGFNLDELPFMHKEMPMAERLGSRDRKLTAAYLRHYPGATLHSALRRLGRIVTQIEE